jgi:hypothetical protein
MISTVLAMMVMAPADVVNRARLDYTRCVQATLKTSLQQKMDLPGFETAAAEACAAKAKSLRTAIVAADTAVGIKRAAAEEGAGLELDDILTNAKENYSDFLKSGASPKS